MSRKIVQAQEHYRNAEKALKTSMFRWKPDFETAADEYSQAGQCYRIAEDMRRAKDCYIKASEMYRNSRSLFHAAKAIESALMICKEKASVEEIETLSVDSANLYQQHGSGDSAAHVLYKGAKILEKKAPHLAVKLYMQAADASSAESGQHQSCEYMGKASRILVSMQKYDQAVDTIRREIGYYLETSNIGAVGRLTLGLVLVQLARGDPIAAEKAYKEWGGNCEVAEKQTIEQLLQAYDDEDRESAQQALASPFIKNMDVEYANLARLVPLPTGMATAAPKAKIRENAAAAYVDPGDVSSIEMHGGPSSRQEETPYEAVFYKEKPADAEEELC